MKFVKDAGFARAGGLAYSSLLAAVPFAALTISLLNAFGALKTVQEELMDFIIQLLIPTKQAEVGEILNQFLTNSSKLGVVGLVFFSMTSVLLLNTVNVNLNAIWGSKVKNNFLSKFTTYTSVIIMGTLLLAVSTTISSSLSFSFIRIESFALINRLLLKAAPFFVDFLIILILIGLTPSGKVLFKSAAIAALTGSVFWEIMKWGFVNISSWAIRASVIYGTIAVIPIFLFWVYIIWMIIIGTMELAWILQHKNTVSHGVSVSEMQPVEKLVFGFQVFLKIAENFNSDEDPLNIDDLSIFFSIPSSDILLITSIFVENQLLLPVGEDELCWVPSRSLSGITADKIIESLFGKFRPREDQKIEAARQVYKFFIHGTESLKKISIEDII